MTIVEPHHNPPVWLEMLGWAGLAAAGASAVAIAADMALRGYRQRMWIMHLVYPVTALYWGPAALWFYVRHGRRTSRPVIEREGEPDAEKLPEWVTSAKAVSHCGAGCVLGDVGGEWLVRATGLTIAGKALYADFLLDFTFAWLLGIGFQYFTIAPMRDIGPTQGLWAAVKADTFSIVAFQIGMFAGMWDYQAILFTPGLAKTTASYWLLMQLAMIVGLSTAWPVNGWLVRAGWKERM
ncbi:MULTISPECIES: DUF4396 domain-containing protein [unclassified Streptomyces]|uniref:DUF4396 domain-containing protein n=1 Tax=unclassified Streptomyces TaxID=2593676 RepID=UPI002E2C0D14|nr:DUF4396 domain-containing protein [Streptomyces sp. NBC_00228]WSW96351.1 DUF4396 domain-containing protein [Streptomyces sp. NBC_00989]